MKLTKQQETEVMPIYKEWWHSYMNGDVKTYDHYLDDDYRFVGSTEAEDFLNKRDTTRFFDATADQLAGKSQLRNSRLTAEYYDGVVFITELADAYLLLGDDWTFYGKFRFSSMLRKKSDGWRFIYQHFSVPDSKAQEGETIGLEQVSKENQELRDAIKRRTAELENKNRDLKIEAALERVRARSSAMQYADELGEVIALIFNILDEFDISVKDGVALITFNEGSKDLNEWMANPGFGTAMNFHLPYFDHPVLSNLWDAKNRGEDFLIERYSEEESRSFLNHIFEHSDFKHTPQHVKEYCLAAGTYATSIALQKHTAIFINDYSGISLTSTEVDLLKRFSTVFEQTYTRFLDIQKAEAQARESQIQLALERVRARTMAMQHSDELMETSELMFEQIKNLGIELWSCGFSLWYDDDSYFLGYNPGPHGKLGNPLKIPLTEDLFFTTIREAKRRGDEFLVFESEGESLVETYRYMDGLPVVGETMRGFVEAGFLLPTYQVTHCGFFSNGHLMFITQEPNSEAIDIFKRFTKVFNQTYTRFLDLQKAEEQVREAQIEAALERVRSRSLAMHKTAELQSVIQTVHQELLNLNISISGGSFIVINSEIDTEIRCWGSGGTADTSNEVHIPHYDKPFYTHLLKGIKKGPGFFTEEYTQEDKIEFFKFLFQYEPWSKLSAKEKKKTLSAPGGYTRSCTVSKHTSIFIINHFGEKFSEADNDILKRFGKVFEQSYTRFLDLQKVEAQAREAQIEAALERVRSRSLAMHKSEELNEVVKVLFEKMTELQVPSTAVAIQTFSESSKDVHCFVCGDVGTGIVISQYLLPYFDHPILEDFHKAREKELDFHVGTYSKKEKDSFYEVVLKLPELKDLPAEVKTMIRESEVYEITMVPAKKSLLAVNDFQGNRLSESQVNILKRFAKVFDQAYTRFLDLQKAEAQAREAQVNLAVERVRARALAMFKSEEILEVVYKLKEEIMGLDIPNVTAATIHLKEPDGKYRAWDLTSINQEGNELEISLDIRWHREDTHPDFFMREVWDRTEDYFVVIQEGDRYKHTVHWLHQNGHSDYAVEFEEFLESSQLEKAYHPTVPLNNGRMCIDLLEPPEPEVESILKKMAGAFDLAYKRFEDLQKAEKQTREAQIEVAVERVRAKALAMHKSTEILQVAVTLKEQMEGLNLSGITAATIYLEHDESKIRVWDITELKESEKGPQLSSDFTFRLEDTDPGLWVRRVWNAREKYSVIEMSGDDFIKCEKWIREFDETAADNYREFIRAAKLEHTWHPTVQLEKGKLNLDFTVPPPPEMDFILPKMGAAFDLAYRRFLDLQKAEAQAREAKIESALERVRSRSLAMHHSSELSAVVDTLMREFTNLEFTLTFCIINLINEQDMSNTVWAANPETGKDPESYYMRFEDYPFHHAMWDAWKAQKKRFVYTLEGEEKKIYDEYLYSETEFRRFPKHVKDANKALERYVAGFTFFMYSGLQTVSVNHISEDELEILERFGRVFEQAYTRFLDLQKAEAQAREAKIETALEKVRSRTMAMQKGEELQEVAVLLYKELIALGVTNFVTCGYVEIHEEIERQYTWVTAPGGDTLGLFYLPLTGDATFDERYAAWKNQQTIFHQSVAGKVRSDHLEYAITKFNSKEAEEMVRSQFPDPTVFYCFNFSHGYLHIVTGSLLEKEEELLLARFTKVFEQTYTRFLDLKKAEAQAREATIEMSLEKIRSRTMGMQSSDELPEVANMLFLEVQELGIPAWSCGYSILTEDRKSSICIMSSEGTIQKPFLLPHYGEVSFREWDNFVQSDKTFFTQELGGKAIDSHYSYMKSLPQLKPVFQDLEDAGLSLPTYQINHLCKFSHGFLLFITYEDVPDAHDIFKRFTSVFDQTYTRFLDLKKAEAQTREAEVELSLERVRSQVTAMQASSDLLDIVVSMRKEFVSLGHTADYFWHMRWLPDSYEMSMTSEDGNRIGMVIRIPKFVHEAMPGLYKWEKSANPFYVLALNPADAWDYIENMNTHGHYEQADPHAPSQEDIQHIGGLTFIIARTSHGEIGYSLPGVVPEPPKKAVDTLTRFAGVFDLAYQRFEDLQESEQQSLLILKERDRLEAALQELHATQDQLIQQEKLASLGQLTAGIAHEIKNPLNFVNNFSELSIELIEESREELSSVSDQLSAEDKERVKEALVILKNVEDNLKKVHQHGSRADSIVKSMLEHSRGGTGKMEPTDLNSLVNEYVNLSFHGMRAGKNPINVDIKLDLEESIGKVKLIAEDFSRVILNLCNNGFDALHEREKVKSEKGEEYHPKLTVRTRSENETVFIEVEDNGSGIPDAIKDKILQPFFTTKKGTQGTGLGLSITNDIIKAHGGQLRIKSLPGEGSTFTINLERKN